MIAGILCGYTFYAYLFVYNYIVAPKKIKEQKGPVGEGKRLNMTEKKSFSLNLV